MSETISVIIPVYNVERYLQCCVKSIINQSYSNLEILLIDDGSTDNSSVICDALAELDPRISVIHKSNGGLSDARNVGLKNASGEYISFVDSDDYLSEDTLEEMISLARREKAEIVICNMQRFDDDGNNSSFYAPYDRETICPGSQRFISLNQPSVCNKLFAARLFKRILFPYGKYYEDTFIYHEVLFSASAVAFTGKTGYWYRSHSDSILGQPIYTERYYDFFEAVYNRMKFLHEKGVYPHTYEACLSLYVAYSNIISRVPKEGECIEKYKTARECYHEAYTIMMTEKSDISWKQKIRLMMLRYAPKLHAWVYGGIQ